MERDSVAAVIRPGMPHGIEDTCMRLLCRPLAVDSMALGSWHRPRMIEGAHDVGSCRWTLDIRLAQG